MNPENPFEIQQQVRENSEELQSFLKDLDNWEKDMKKKDQELKFIKMVEEDTIPPIRNTSSRSKKKSKNKKQKDKEKIAEPERISSYNYSAWEKFDVDSELKKLDEEKKESSASESSDSEELLQMQQKKQLAILKKDKGNDFFKKGHYDTAINCYTIGMELDPDNPLLPANRAMAFLKKEQFQAAENDCTLCISLDPTYIKAYLRRGTARRALKKFLLAREDYLKVLELEPGNKLVQVELEKLKKEVITELESSPTKEDLASLKEMYSDLETNKMNENSKTPSSRLENLIRTMEQPAEPVIPFIGIDTSRSSESDLPNPSCSKEPVKTKSPVQLEDFSEIENVVKRLEQSLPPVPSAAYQFLTDWRKLSKYPDLKYQYLKQFPPERLPILFRHDMETEILCGILQTLSTLFLDNGDDVFSFLKHLSQVGRFQTLLLFLSNEEKKDLKKLIDSLKCMGDSSEVEELIKLYKA